MKIELNYTGREEAERDIERLEENDRDCGCYIENSYRVQECTDVYRY